MIAVVGLVITLGALASLGAGLLMQHYVPIWNQNRVDTTQKNEQSNARLLSVKLADTDADGALEPLPMVTSASAPANGGILPTGIGLVLLDAWNTNFGYCAWNNGAVTAAAGLISGVAVGYNAAPLFSIISAGPNKTFETTCAQAAANTPQGDDVLFTVNYSSGVLLADFWTIDNGSQTVSYGSVSGKPVAIGKAVAQAGFMLDVNGASQTSSLTVNGQLTGTSATISGAISGGSLSTSDAIITGGSIANSSAALTSLSVSGTTSLNTLATTGAAAIGGVLSAPVLASTAPTGTAPLSVASTTMVANLNSNYLGNQPGSFYQNASNIDAGTVDPNYLPGISGDLSIVRTGVNSETASVTAIRGAGVSAAAPGPLQVLMWNGAQYVPTTLAAGSGGNVALVTPTITLTGAVIGSGSTNIVTSLATTVAPNQGGTGLTSLTAHGLLVGEGTGSVTMLGPCPANDLVQFNGAGVDPSCTNTVTAISITAGGASVPDSIVLTPGAAGASAATLATVKETGGDSAITLNVSPAGAGTVNSLLSGVIDLNADTVFNNFGYIESVPAAVNSGTALTINSAYLNPLQYNIARITLTGNATITLPSAAQLGPAQNYNLLVELVEGGSFTPTFAAPAGDSIAWNGGVFPAACTTNGSRTFYEFTRNGGETVWVGLQAFKGC